MNKTDLVDKLYLRTDLPPFRPGDTVKVHVRVVEAGRERVQVFQGVVIRRQGGGLQETFTVRKISFGVGVERTFPLHSPSIAKLEVVSRGKVRRAKLYYLRERRGKKARIRERRVEGEELLALQALEAEAVAEADAEGSGDAGTAEGEAVELVEGAVPQSAEPAAEADGGEVRLDDERVAERLHHDHHVHRGTAEASVLRVERHAEDAHLGEGGPDVFAPSRRRGDDLRTRVEAVAGTEELAQGLGEEALLVAVLEVHVVSSAYRPSVALAMMLRWISFDPA